MTDPRMQGLSKLTRRHGVKVASAVSVEDCCLAAGEVVGHEHIMSASRMNSATVIFLSSVEKANERFVYMILKDDEDLDLSLHLKVDEFDYVIYATTDKMKCFKCGEVGHLIRACPGKNQENVPATVDIVNVSEPVEAGPSNAARPAAVTAEENPPAVETAATQGYLDSLSNKRTQLADLLGIKTQGALVRSRFQSVDQMDAPSRFFFNLEKKNGQSRVIHALRSESGGLLTNPADIRKRAVGFYENLYKNEIGVEYRSDSDFFNDLPQVSEEVNTEISGALSMAELYKALQGMESGKAPGIDGLPVDFYKSFWSELGEDLLEVLNESLAEGQLPLSCRRAVLTLLPKKGDLADIKCWRPVSLLCSDYKLLSKTLANRLAGVMDGVIHPDQTYCVPGRFIFCKCKLEQE
ncbi:hypothetical protein F2P79_025374 [Pimephales promelas]|nr:hypothetical protein F2P79_025374 [Pimephales promelas]